MNEEFLASLKDRGAVVKYAKSGKLHTLDVRSIASTLSDDELLQITTLADVRHLELDGCAVTDSIAERMVDLVKLKHLDLQNTQVTDRSVDVFRQLPKLQFLLLTGSQVSRDAVESLRKNLIGTRIVYL